MLSSFCGTEQGDRLQTSSASECWCYTTKNGSPLPRLGTTEFTPSFYIPLLLKCHQIFDAYLKRLLHPVSYHLQRNYKVLTVNDLTKKITSLWRCNSEMKLVYGRDTSFLGVNGRRGNEWWDPVLTSHMRTLRQGVRNEGKEMPSAKNKEFQKMWWRVLILCFHNIPHSFNYLLNMRLSTFRNLKIKVINIFKS